MATETVETIDFDRYLALCREAHSEYPSWRWGQALFNILHLVRPDLSARVRGSLIDPFYSEGSGPKVHKFLAFVAENW